MLEMNTFFHLTLEFDTFGRNLFRKLLTSISTFFVLKRNRFDYLIGLDYFLGQIIRVVGDHL